MCQSLVSHLGKSLQGGPQGTHTVQSVDTNYTKCINNDSTLAKKTRSLPAKRTLPVTYLALLLSTAIPLCSNPKGSRTKRGWKRRSGSQQTMLSDNDGVWAVVGSYGLVEAGKRRPLTPAESSLTYATAWLGKSPPVPAVHRAAVHPIWLQHFELWIPPFLVGYEVPACDIS